MEHLAPVGGGNLSDRRLVTFQTGAYISGRLEAHDATVRVAVGAHQSNRHTKSRERPGTKIKRYHSLAIAIDTSGSIQEKTLEIFFHEIDSIWRGGSRVHVVLCDAAVHGSFEWKGRVPVELGGGGGTAFDPVFRWVHENRRLRIDGCIYLSDGEGPMPEVKPPCPLLWVLTTNAQGLPFGPSIRIDINN